jgi:hypothetical protein
MQYTGSAFSYAVRGFLGSGIGIGFARYKQDAHKRDEEGVSVWSPLEAEIEVAPGRWVSEPFRKAHNVAITLVQSLSERVSRTVQNGDIRRYLTYMLAATLIILLLVAWRSG